MSRYLFELTIKLSNKDLGIIVWTFFVIVNMCESSCTLCYNEHCWWLVQFDPVLQVVNLNGI